MSTIKFENGTTVNFQGNPTPQDVEEVATKLGLSSHSHPAAQAQQFSSNPILRGLQKFGQHGQNIANGIASDIAQPFTKVVGSGVRAIEAIPSVLKGNAQKADEIMQKPIFGQKTLQGSTPLQNLGTAAQVGSFALGGGEANAIGSGVVKESTILGAKIGGLQGGGSYLAGKDKPSLLGTVASTAGGAAGGALFGAGLAKLQQMALPEKQLESAWKAVQPNLTIKEQTQAIKDGELAVQNGKAILLPQGQSSKMRNLAAGLGVRDSNDPITNINLLKNGISESATKVRADLQGSKAIWNQNELKGALQKNVLNKIEKGVPGFITVKSDASLNSQAQNLVGAVNDLAVYSNRHPTGLLDIRQAFDDAVEKEYGTNIFSKTDPKGNVVRAIRQTLNDLVEFKAPGSKAEMRNQSLLYDAIDNIASKAPKSQESGGLGYQVGSTKFQRFFNHPLTKVLEAGIGGTAIYEGAKKLFGK